MFYLEVDGPQRKTKRKLNTLHDIRFHSWHPIATSLTLNREFFPLWWDSLYSNDPTYQDQLWSRSQWIDHTHQIISFGSIKSKLLWEIDLPVHICCLRNASQVLHAWFGTDDDLLGRINHTTTSVVIICIGCFGGDRSFIIILLKPMYSGNLSHKDTPSDSCNKSWC